MRVGLDVTPAVVGITGIARYALMLWKHLASRTDVDVRAFAGGRGPHLDGAHRIPMPLRTLHYSWHLLGWPKAETVVGEVDVVHSIDLVPPPTRHPLVMTIHDALAVTHPELVPKRARRLQRQQLAAAARADVVITTCHATAHTAAEATGVPLDKIVVAPLGALDARPVQKPPPYPSPYVLAVGAVTPRKGFDALASAAAQLGQDCPPIVIAGPDGWRADDVRRAVSEADTSSRVRFIGEVDDATLAALYQHSNVVCHPSIAEGFGMVCLEAMTYGCPVIATDIPSTREIAAESVTYVPVSDPDALAEAMRTLLDDKSLRDDLSARARLRSRAFSWERMTERVVHAYSRAIR